MKDIITSREELLWAKLAGRNVYLSTMTPPVASSMKEKLMLETAERIGAGAGGVEIDYIDADFDTQITSISNISMTPEEAIASASDKYLIFRLDTNPSSEHGYVYVPIHSCAAPYSIAFSRVIILSGELQYVEISGSGGEWSVTVLPITQLQNEG